MAFPTSFWLAGTGQTESVLVMRGNGSGSFVAGTPVPAGSNLSGGILADLNGDGNLDLLLKCLPGTGDMVLLGHANGTFDPPLQTLPGNGFLKDVDLDGHLDWIGGTNDARGSHHPAWKSGWNFQLHHTSPHTGRPHS